MRIAFKTLSETPKGGDNLGDLGMDRRKLFKLILKK
jgi:hypothetical protein